MEEQRTRSNDAEVDMLDRLREIDTSALDQLSQLKQEQEILEDRLQKMEERSESVSPIVFERVREDYQKRLRELEDEARPLKARGREEFAKLTALHKEAEEALESARLDGEELQFRNELGEFPEDEFKELSKESSKVVKERQSHVDEAEKLKAAFVEAFRSEEELAQDDEGPVPPPPPVDEGTEEIAEEPMPPELPDADADADAEDGDSQRDTLPPLPEDEDLDDTKFETDATRELETEDGESEDSKGDEDPESQEEGEPQPQADPTIILTRARFVALDGPDADQEFILSETSATVGRAPDNDIRIPDESVSRHHAEVVEGPEGHTVRDLGSENGTYVNGEPIEERRLSDGDVVQVGSCRLVFRL
jgi:hypothetical protein